MSLKKTILTFDDGPNDTRLGKLELLKAYGIPAVFFSEGRCLEKRPEIALETLKNGFALGNHAYSHPHFSDLSLKKGEEEILRTHRLLEEIHKAAEVEWRHRWFRFPYGDQGDGRRGFVFSKWRFGNTARYKYFQDLLFELGYEAPNLEGLAAPFSKKQNQQLDWTWTLDVQEWTIGRRLSRFGKAQSLVSVLTRLQEARPSDLRGFLGFQTRWLGAKNASEIILMHDHDEAHGHFTKIMEALRAMPLDFQQPG